MEGAGSYFVQPTARVADDGDLLLQDAEWAALAAAGGSTDEARDADCAKLVEAVDEFAALLGRSLSTQMLGAKSALAQRAQARQAQVLATAESEQRRLLGLLDEEIAARNALQAQLDHSRAVQQRMADALAHARESGATRLQAFAVLSDWQRMLAAQKREAFCERASARHDRRRLLRKVVCRWRTHSRALRHTRIDAFWENACVELREALQGHYEPRLAELEAKLSGARSDAADAWRAKEDLGKQLKAAFMRGVCQLNLETATILEASTDEPAERAAPPPKPLTPEELLENARRGLQLEMTRR